MKRFIKTSISVDGFQEIKQTGNKYLVHLEPTINEDVIECYECITEEYPDIEKLKEELNEWKNYISNKELEFTKKSKCNQVLEYDASSEIRSFQLNFGNEKIIDYWIGKDLRNSLENDIKVALTIGNIYKFDIREINLSFDLSCNKLLEMLNKLRQYAYTSYNVTSQHLLNINNLNSVEQISNYDFTKNYPEKLIFNIEDLV